MATVELLTLRASLLTPADVPIVERMLRESNTWVLADGLAANVVGSLIDRFDEMGTVLDRWSVDPDFWIRRSVLLALLKGLRRGDGDFDRFTRCADSMLDEKEFFIRKAIGWVLRDTGRRRPDIVYEWLLALAGLASTITVKEAVKPLSADQRAAVLAARATGAPRHSRRSCPMSSRLPRSFGGFSGEPRRPNLAFLATQIRGPDIWGVGALLGGTSRSGTFAGGKGL